MEFTWHQPSRHLAGSPYLIEIKGATAVWSNHSNKSLVGIILASNAD
jgi:hypothetical protein